MVIREYEAEGPVTGIVLTLVGFNNLVSVLGFAVLAHFLIFPGEGYSILLMRMGGPVLVGALMGFAMSVWAQRLERLADRPFVGEPGVGDDLGEQLPSLESVAK